MPSGINADLLAALKSRPTNALVLFDFVGKRYSEAWAAAGGTGLYEGRVVESGSITRGVSDSGFNLPDDAASVTIRDDKARTLEKVVMGTSAGSISEAVATITLASTTLASSKWFTLFSGIIDSFGSPESYVWNFSLKRRDKALKNLVRVPTIQVYDWPNAPAASLGEPANIVYGKHSSAGTASTGMVPTIYVDNSGFRYVISAGRISSLDNVYVDNVASAAANWALAYVDVNGRTWSVVDFTGDQGTAVVTVDCEGFETVGDGTSGTVITNPATQLEHFLANWVFEAYTSGLWLEAANAPINETFFEDTEIFLSDKQIDRGSRVIAGDRKGIDVLNEWCNEFQIPCFWSYAGEIAIRPDDHTIIAYTSVPHFRQEISPERARRSMTFSTQELVDEIRVDYIYDSAANTFRKKLTVRDPVKDLNAAQSLQLHWREAVA